jgi:hypothetical protein
MLRVYISAHCPGSPTACRLVEQVRTCYPDIPVATIHVDDPDTIVPEHIFATPIYTWNDDILFLGNPGEAAFLEWARRLDERQQSHDGAATGS